MKKNLLLVASLFFGAVAFAQECIAVASVNENFSNFTLSTSSAVAFPQQCWNSFGATAAGPWIYTAQKGDPANKYAVYYTHMAGANVAGYIITPELSTIDGDHELSFDTYKLGGGPNNEIPAGNITVQVGLISNPASVTDFENVGAAFTVTATSETHANIVIPASTTKKYVAFKFLADAAVNAAALDNVVWSEVAVVTPECTAVASLDENFSNFTLSTSSAVAFPQQCWNSFGATAAGPWIYTAQKGDPANKYAVYYTHMAGANVAGYIITPELSTIDGDHELSFDTYKLGGGPNNEIPAGNITVQVGLISNPASVTDFENVGTAFTVTGTSATHANIVIPASTTKKYVAFKFLADAAVNAAALDNVVWSEVEVVTPECTAIASLDENFNDFTDLPENCWSVIAPPAGPFLSIDGEGDQYVSFYSFTAVDVVATVVSPELSTIGQNYALSFDAGMNVAGVQGVVTLQVGTLTDASDASTFTAVGSPITVSANMTPYTDIAIPSGNGNFVGFRISANAAHVAAKLDNIKWQTTAGVEDFDKASFSIFPNPTANKNVTINHNIDAKGTVSVYTLTGAMVANSELSAGSQNLNLSSLSAGVYIVKIEAGNQTATKKLIVQ